MKDFIDNTKKIAKQFIGEVKNLLKDVCSIKTIKNQIANMFTLSRLVLIPFIIMNIISGNLITAGLLTIGASLTDCVDGYVARKLGTSSEFGAKLDAVIDKIFIVTVALPLAIIQPHLLLPIVLDIVIGSINGYSHLKGYVTETSKIGKKKTIFLDALIASSFFTSIPFLQTLNTILYPITIVLQLEAGKGYYNRLQDKKSERQSKINTDDNNKDIEEEEIVKKNVFNKEMTEKEILEYYKKQCTEEKENKKVKQLTLRKK